LHQQQWHTGEKRSLKYKNSRPSIYLENGLIVVLKEVIILFIKKKIEKSEIKS